MSIKLKYNGVVVIQSLPNEEKQTGKMLFDDIIARRCEQSQKGKYFFDVDTKDDFFQALREICANVELDDLWPIIHFEIHGCEDGFVLKQGDLVRWKEIQNYCRFINQRLKNQLIITLATCYGSMIWQMIDITKPAPYWGYIGPKESIFVSQLMEDFTELYDILLTAESWDLALGQLKLTGSRDQYIYLHCKGIFEYHLERVLKGVPIDKAVTFKRLVGQTKVNTPWLNRSERRKQLKTSIDRINRDNIIASLKKVFLMLD